MLDVPREIKGKKQHIRTSPPFFICTACCYVNDRDSNLFIAEDYVRCYDGLRVLHEVREEVIGDCNTKLFARTLRVFAERGLVVGCARIGPKHEDDGAVAENLCCWVVLAA